MKKNIYYTFLFALLALLAASCSEERLVGGDTEAGGDAVLHFRVSTPAGGGGETRAATRNGSAGYENPINNVTAIFFDSQNKVAYTRYGLNINSDPATGLIKFRIDARASASSVTLWLVANVTFGTGAGEILLPAAGQSMDEVRAAIHTAVTAGADYGIAQGFPYWGEKTLTSIPANTPATPLEVSGIRMLRAVAKATIQKTVDDATLKITSLRIYRMNNRMAAVPAAVNAQNAVTAPTVPATAAAMPDPTASLSIAGFSPTQPLVCYLSESAAAASADDALNKATCLVVGGQFGGGTAETFYRVDFPQGAHAHPGEILRNHHYQFNIQRVSGAGWSTPEAAATQKPTALTVQVKDWADTWESLKDGEYEFSISARDIPLAGASGSENYIDLSVINIPGFYLMFAGGNGTTQETGTIENENFRLRLTDRGAGSYRVTATALKDNVAADARVQTVQVSAGKLSFAITLTQAPVSELKPATTFLWVASDGDAHKQTIAIESSHPWHVDAAQTDAWIKYSAAATPNPTALTVWGEPNHNTANESRTGTLRLVNDLNQQVFITVKQVRWVEWTKAYLRGGNCFQGNGNGQFAAAGDQSYLFYIISPPNTSVGLAATAGDVHHVVSWAVTEPDPPANYAMQGDLYSYDQAVAACASLNLGDGKKWKLASREEGVDFLLRVSQTTPNETLFIENPDHTLCYFPYPGSNYFPKSTDFWHQMLLHEAQLANDQTFMLNKQSLFIFYKIDLPLRCVRDYRP